MDRFGEALDRWLTTEPDSNIAEDREETEPCERGTVGCCIRHGSDDTDCETW